MTLMLRDLPDGRVQISLASPLVIATVKDRDMASFVCAFVDADIAEFPDDLAEVPAADDDATVDLAALEAALFPAADAGSVTETPKTHRRSKRRGSNLPVVAEVPRAPAKLAPAKLSLTEDQREAAFMRLGGGEPIAIVAQAFGVAQAQLRGAYGHHCKLIQRHLAEGGQQPCSLCQKPFIPSLTRPETCARCSHG